MVTENEKKAKCIAHNSKIIIQSRKAGDVQAALNARRYPRRFSSPAIIRAGISDMQTLPCLIICSLKLQKRNMHG